MCKVPCPMLRGGFCRDPNGSMCQYKNDCEVPLEFAEKRGYSVISEIASEDGILKISSDDTCEWVFKFAENYCGVSPYDSRPSELYIEDEFRRLRHIDRCWNALKKWVKKEALDIRKDGGWRLREVLLEMDRLAEGGEVEDEAEM